MLLNGSNYVRRFKERRKKEEKKKKIHKRNTNTRNFTQHNKTPVIASKNNTRLILGTFLINPIPPDFPSYSFIFD